MHITFVCTGNTCRSPMAEGIFNSIINERNLKDFSCESCGIYAYPGDEVTPEAVEAVKKYGADISSHRSRAFSRYIIDNTDLFVCMTASHAAAVKTIAPNKKTVVLGVSDPYGGNAAVYDACAAQIKASLDILTDLLTVKITDFCKADVRSVYELEKECFSSPWSIEGIEAELDNDTAHFLCAKSGDKVMAYLGVHEVAGEAYISNIAVSAPYRKNGIASSLMDKAERNAKERECEFISLEVRKSNSAAISLYKKRGYTVRGERKDFYSEPKEDALIMTLDLKE